MNTVYPLLLSHANRRSWRAPWHPAPTFCLIRIVVHDIELLENRQHVGVILAARAVSRIARAKTGLLYDAILGCKCRAIASRVGDKIPSL